MPNSLAPVRNKNTFRQIALFSIFTAVVFYMAVGAVCAYYFNAYVIFGNFCDMD